MLGGVERLYVSCGRNEGREDGVLCREGLRRMIDVRKR